MSKDRYEQIKKLVHGMDSVDVRRLLLRKGLIEWGVFLTEISNLAADRIIQQLSSNSGDTTVIQ